MVNEKKIGNILFSSLLPLLFFVFVFSYFFWFGNHIFSFQESQSLFIYSEQYVHDFLIKPGGILVFCGKFLTQFYYNGFLGSVLVALALTMLAFLFRRLLKTLNIKSSLIPVLSVSPACCLLLMQSHYYHFMEQNLGYLSVLLFLQLAVYYSKKRLDYLVLILFPFYYYLVGAFAWIFVGLYVIYLLFFGLGVQKFIYSISIVLFAVMFVFVFKQILFLQPRNLLFGYPLHAVADSTHRLATYMLYGCFVVAFLMGKLTFNTKIFSSNVLNLTSLVVMILAGLLLYRTYNVQTARTLKLEQYVFGQKWNEAIGFGENCPSGNLIGQYFYNVVLSESDQLCSRMFSGAQNFGTGSLILPWGNEHLGFGAYFYYAVGLVNEAHRWAYEDMVVNGQKPSNLKMLVKTNLINGNVKMAEKYINILKKTYQYKKWALEYEKLANDTTLIKRDTELERQRENMPKGDFFIQVDSPQNNIPLLIEANPANKRAFEYKMAWLMLSKDIEGVVGQMKLLSNLGYTHIPRHLEEAAMIYYNAKGIFPDMGGLQISAETTARFGQYVSVFKNSRQNMALAKERLGALFGNTFMFYYHFK